MNNTIAIIKVKGDMTLPIYLELTDDFKEAISNGCTEVIMDFSDTNLIAVSYTHLTLPTT